MTRRIETRGVLCTVCCLVLPFSAVKLSPTYAVGLTVAEVRLIFKFTAEHSNVYGQPLAYVQWFTSFQARDHIVGMYTVSRSTRNHHRRASIIPISDITRSCHLIPVWGQSMDRTLTRHTALARCSKFLVNPYLRHSDFVIFRFLLDRWLQQEHDRAAAVRS